MSVHFYQTTRRNGHLHTCRHENLRSYLTGPCLSVCLHIVLLGVIVVQHWESVALYHTITTIDIVIRFSSLYSANEEHRMDPSIFVCLSVGDLNDWFHSCAAVGAEISLLEHIIAE